MNDPFMILLFSICLALLAILHFCLQRYLAKRDKSPTEGEPLVEQEKKSVLDFFRSMPLPLLVFMVFTVTYYGLLLTALMHYEP